MATSEKTPKTAIKRNARKKEKEPGNSSCTLCEQPDNDDMVLCDNCDQWFHFKCVNVDESVKNHSWACENCTTSKEKAPSVTARSTTSHRSQAETAKSRRSRQRELQLQRLEEERALAEQRDKEALLRQQARDKEYFDKRFQLLSVEEHSDLEEEIDDQVGTSKENVNLWLQTQCNEAGKQHGSAAIELTNFGQIAPHPNTSAEALSKTQPQLLQPSTKSVVPTKIDDAVADTEPNCWYAQRLTSNQIAARHAIPKDLPTFDGQPEDWPLFISCYEGANEVCGFSNVENLIRLQRCLKGRALEDVRSRLLLPNNVPGIIETLKMRYGRPELIIHTLLKKVNDEPSPQAEKLETIVSFALAVENLCSTMEACNMISHLTNPVLLQELVEKLPAQIRLNWATYSCSQSNINLATFSKWLMQLANTVSTVTYSIPQLNNKVGKPVNHGRGRVGVHDQDPKPKKKSCCICMKNCNKVENCSKFNDLILKDRWNAVKQNALCRLCLYSHLRSRCRLSSPCGINGCPYKHHRLLHNSDGDNVPPVHKPDEDSVVPAQCHTHNDSGQAVYFRILPVHVHGKNGPVKVFVFLDEGSSVSLMDESLAKELQLNGYPEPLCLKWTGDTHRMEDQSQIVSVKVSPEGKVNKQFTISDVRTVSALKLPSQSIDMKNMVACYPYLKGLPITSYNKAVPRILIGLNNWRLGVQLNYREGTLNEPVASKTRLGWTIYGAYQQQANLESNNHEHQNFHHCECQQTSDSKLHDMMKQFFSLDSLGVAVNSSESMMSPEDQRACQLMEKETTRRGDHYETGLLWRYDEAKLPDSFPMALRRFRCLQLRLNQDAELKENLRRQFDEYEKKQYIRKLTKSELQQHHPRIWYLPVFPVRNPNKPGKTRIVWDAAATVKGISLNSMLLKGPDLLTPMLGVLYRFRERSIGICGDIREMYHQVRIKSEDQHSQRFLWNQTEDMGDPDVYVTQVMTFGAKCSPSCAQFVKNKNANEFLDDFPRAVECIIKNHYVDDLLDSLDTEAEAIQLGREVTRIHQHGGFCIGKWISNSTKVVSALGGDAAKVKRSLNLCSEEQAEKVLGMWWNTSTDSFMYVIGRHKLHQEILSDNRRRPTKREVLRTLMSIFDPLGLIAHFLIHLKILLQDIWKDAIGWDEQISEERFAQWCQWTRLLDSMEELAIPRCYLTNMKFSDEIKTELHVFVDASKNAFAAVAYFRCSFQGKVECILVGAKTRVASLKLVSIPRLELEAARLGVRLANAIIEGHSVEISRKVFWSDSKTVLSWLRANHRNYRQFVTFRVAEILESSSVKEWRYVPSKANVADEGTKWQKQPGFDSASRWFTGPTFLWLSEVEWPPDSAVSITSEEEIRPHLFVLMVKSEVVVDVSHFNNWVRLLRSQAYVLRFAYNALSIIKGLPRRSGFFTKGEFQDAANYIYRQAQLDVYSKEIMKLSDDTTKVVDKSSAIYKLSPYLDVNGVLRSFGRIDAAYAADYDVKRPILLPRHHHTCRLIILDTHERFHHQQSETVINELRQKFWIPNMRAAVKEVIKNCQYCKNQRATPQPPMMGSLPPARLAAFRRPFSFAGIDYFGPMTVAIGRRTEKRWGVIITCMTTRAIHLEVASSLSSDSCILAIKRFMARRGIPLEFHSDNGTNFHGAYNEIQEAIKRQSDIAEKLSSPATKWCFIPPSSPHMGGTWERMVQTVKKVLKEVMPIRNPSDELLHSMLVEVEKTVNCHPLTYVPLGDENDEALTPNHFLLGTSDGHKPDVIRTDDTTLLRKDWLKSQQLANRFWKRWLKEYLPSLTRRGKWWRPAKPIEVGDIVIIVDDSHPRNFWPKGRVLDRTVSSDGQVRKVTVQTSSGIYVRPAVKIAVLDVQGVKPTSVVLPGGSVVDNATSTPTLMQDS